MNTAKYSPVAEIRGIHPETVAFLIAVGKITRDRACAGKKRYRTYDYAASVRDTVLRKLESHVEVYACPFCGGFHLSSVKEMAS